MKTQHSARRKTRLAGLAAMGAVILATGLLSSTATFASHPEVSLTGSNFEIDTDANLKVDDAGSLDWANVTEKRKADAPSGTGDNSFGQGTKEDTAVPTVVSGSIPPNKSDLKFFGAYQEGTSSTGFLNLFWSRVQDPTGTTNMDFEFNQSKTASSNGVTPVRTAGDLLITYDLSNGGTNPTLGKRIWNGTAWGAPTRRSATRSRQARSTPRPSRLPSPMGSALSQPVPSARHRSACRRSSGRADAPPSAPHTSRAAPRTHSVRRSRTSWHPRSWTSPTVERSRSTRLTTSAPP
jgi:hypothetical protein